MINTHQGIHLFLGTGAIKSDCCSQDLQSILHDVWIFVDSHYLAFKFIWMLQDLTLANIQGI